MISRALLSVSDKSGIVDFARGLHALGVEILSTGGTARLLTDAGVDVIEVSDFTGFPEMMGGRVKTLHPKIHGGILARRGADEATMAANGIVPIDLVVVNLYPFEETVTRPDCDLPTAIENIDIGGPTLLRAAAKNHAAVTVVVDSEDYPAVLEEMHANGNAVSAATRYTLAVKTFEYTARYDGAIANYLGATDAAGERSEFPRTLNLQYQKAQTMRYGENPHQRAAFYVEHAPREASVATAHQLQGKALSYNNVADTDAALECVKSFTEGPACVIVKHANPCGAALGRSALEAYRKAFRTDPTSAFGGIIACNRALDRAAAAQIGKQFAEVIIAPRVAPDARAEFAKKQNLRVLEVPLARAPNALDLKRVGGGLLVQSADAHELQAGDLKGVTKKKPTKAQLADLLFAWRVAKFVKSNAIVFAKGGATLGVGAGQMSRIDSARIAAIKAKAARLTLKGSVAASDAFFPFRDGLDAVAKAGAVAVIQPGGSVRDDEVIAAADERKIAMLFTGVRHFRH